jgi:hypothetical protein
MRRGFLAASFLTIALPSYAAELTAEGTAITLRGLIGPGDGDTFKVKAELFPDKATVVLNSPGGNLLAAFAIGEYIRIRGWSTYVSDECDSACALIWLGGAQRLMTRDAKIGFHAASINGQKTGFGNVALGAYLNRIGLSDRAAIYATQSGPDAITYLTPGDAKRVGIEVSVVEPEAHGPAKLAPGQPRFTLGETPKQTRPADPNTARLQAENEVLLLIRYIFSNTSNSANILTSIYWDSVFYYGKITSLVNILADKQRFFETWPVRSYAIRSMTPAHCKADNGIVVECRAGGIVDWEVSNPTRKSVGAGTFEYVLTPWPFGSWSVGEGGQVGLRITAENGSVIRSQVVDLTDQSASKAKKVELRLRPSPSP